MLMQSSRTCSEPRKRDHWGERVRKRERQRGRKGDWEKNGRTAEIASEMKSERERERESGLASTCCTPLSVLNPLVRRNPVSFDVIGARVLAR